MGRGSIYRGKSLTADIIKWKHVGGGSELDGKLITKPMVLEQAELIDAICQRYSCLPSQLLGEDVGLLRILHMVNLGEKKKNG